MMLSKELREDLALLHHLQPQAVGQVTDMAITQVGATPSSLSSQLPLSRLSGALPVSLQPPPASASPSVHAQKKIGLLFTCALGLTASYPPSLPQLREGPSSKKTLVAAAEALGVEPTELATTTEAMIQLLLESARLQLPEQVREDESDTERGREGREGETVRAGGRKRGKWDRKAQGATP